MSPDNWTTYYVLADTSYGNRPPYLVRFQAKRWGAASLKTKKRLSALNYSTVVSNPDAFGVSTTPQGALDHFRIKAAHSIAVMKGDLEKAQSDYAKLPVTITEADAVEEKE